MTRQNEIRELIAYHRWAIETLLDAVATLSDDDFTRDLKSSFPSIRDTIVHLASADWAWLERLNGTSPQGMPEAWKAYDLARIGAQWQETTAAVERYTARLGEADLDRRVDYRSLAGDPYVSTVGQILRHVVNHGSYHRGQVTTMMRQLGATPPSMDLIRYYRSIAPSLPHP